MSEELKEGKTEIHKAYDIKELIKQKEKRKKES